jgi:hypothetical protein
VQEVYTMKKTWMPKVAGILSIVAGVINLLAVFLMAIGAFMVQGVFGFFAVPFWIPFNASMILFIMSFPFLVSGVLAIVGGAYAVQRKKWGLALTGSIIAFFPYCILGMVSSILLALSKEEFESENQRASIPAHQAV